MKFVLALTTFSILTPLLGATSLNSGISAREIRKNSAAGLRLLRFKPGTVPVWTSNDEVKVLLRNHTHFLDVTETYDPAEKAKIHLLVEGEEGYNQTSPPYQYLPPTHQVEVSAIHDTLTIQNMQNYLTNLTSFYTRFYNSSTGRDAAIYIYDTIAELISSYNATSNASVSFFNHSSWIQPSVIARIPGSTSEPDHSSCIIVLGAHLDSINLDDFEGGRAPGADDDGSGSVNLMEAFRGLIANGFKPKHDVEFHWYAGEEVGLLGSQAIAKSYRESNIRVAGMMQLDMTAYVKPGSRPVIALMPDFTTPTLSNFTALLISTYLSTPWVINSPCGYGCSDHASWYELGYPTVLPFESLFEEFTPYLHTENDEVIEINSRWVYGVSNLTDLTGLVGSGEGGNTLGLGWNWTHSFEYSKLGVAFAYELGMMDFSSS